MAVACSCSVLQRLRAAAYKIMLWLGCCYRPPGCPAWSYAAGSEYLEAALAVAEAQPSSDEGARLDLAVDEASGRVACSIRAQVSSWGGHAWRLRYGWCMMVLFVCCC
jgi:hypothetical protein